MNPAKSAFAHYKPSELNNPKSRQIFHSIIDTPDNKKTMMLAHMFLQSLGQDPGRDALDLCTDPRLLKNDSDHDKLAKEVVPQVGLTRQ